MRVRDLLGRKSGTLVTVEPKAELAAAVRLLIRHHVGGLPVQGPDGVTVGFLAERDVVRAMDRHLPESVRHLRVEDVMQPTPTCGADDSLEDVMRRMSRDRLRHLVVQDGARTIGVISVGDMVKTRLEQLETETGVLRDYVAAHRASR